MFPAMMPLPGEDTTGGGFEALFGLAVVVVVIGLIVTLVLKVRNVSKVIDSGNDPTTFQTDLAIRAMKSEALAPERNTPEKTTAERLRELDALLADGTITADEHAAARIRVLGDV